MGQLHLRGIARLTLETGMEKKDEIIFYELTPVGEWKEWFAV